MARTRSQPSRLAAPHHRTIAAVALLAALAAAGCAPPAQTATQPIVQTRTDLLRAQYPDLASGRFAVVADFEDRTQLELFHSRGADVASTGLSVSAAGVPETGGHCLAMRFEGADVQLVANNDNAKAWLLKRDWRDYTLLLMNVHSSSEGARLGLELAGGEDARAATTRASWKLSAGWNLLRLDLGEAGQLVPLDNVREIRWSVEPGPQPVMLRLDDVLLTDNRTTVFGSTEGPEGTLYVQHAGRRIHVGAVGRFELGFANGQIVRWYALADDPARLRDLVGAGNTLGPTPVRLPPGADWSHEADWRWLLAGAGAEVMVAANQRLMEANGVRAVVECTWSVTTGEQATQLARWLYVIYPSGQVYATVLCGSGANSAEASDIGLAVSRAPQEFLNAELHAPGRLGDLPDLAPRSFACLSAGESGADLFFMLHDGVCGPQLQAVSAADTARYSVVAYAGGPDCPGRPWSALLGVGPAGECAPRIFAACARAYGGLGSIELIVGDYERESVGDMDADGFNERFGAYMLVPEAGRVQLRLRAATAPIMSPVFSVSTGGAGEAWVYVDNLIYEAVARDAQGHLIFQVPGLRERDTLVEVYLRNAAPPVP